ncbi:transketolase [Desulfitibacter alkalitolerans]|uniref:transketolase n=1 Tax=Desulfitibacter alkalitolerans TaxID=264641 RepID=UPI0004897D68|nr:transketolase [Desulfitibacter alkalitolerans]
MTTIEQQLSINTIRVLSAEAVEKANSGHPGLPLGLAPAGYVLWSQVLKHSPHDPKWPNRDRFILSAGHGSMLLYSLLHLFDYGLTMEDIKSFRQLGSKTPGHPEYGHTVGVETTTGPLGQGFANGVGMAVAEKRLAARFNRDGYEIVDHYTYIFTSDGDLMEGISSEAASLAGHLKLGKLICIYDDNTITIDGHTSLTFTEDVGMRFKAYGWQVINVQDGNDTAAILAALKEAKKDSERPALIMLKTIIGYGSPTKQGKADVHGAPLGREELAGLKKNLGWHYTQEFHVPEEVRQHFFQLTNKLNSYSQEWKQLFSNYKQAYPGLAREWETWHLNKLPDQLLQDSELWNFEDKPIATRSASGQVMNKLTNYLPNLVGGSADLNASTKTYLKNMGDFQAHTPEGSNLFFGIREHAMAGILNGMALHGGFRVFGSTFFVFFDYMKPSIRLAALMGLPVIYVFTHDSLGVGEDGPTHQPIEHLIALRAIPNMHVLRPCDARETTAAWLTALERQDGPTAIILTRQNLPILENSSMEAQKGAYIIGREKGTSPDLIILATGSEVALALEAQKELWNKSIDARVVSMMSWELFKEQPINYREGIIPASVSRRISVEAGSSLGWRDFVGDKGIIIGIDSFGASAPGRVLLEHMGFSVSNIVEKAVGLFAN